MVMARIWRVLPNRVLRGLGSGVKGFGLMGSAGFSVSRGALVLVALYKFQDQEQQKFRGELY